MRTGGKLRLPARHRCRTGFCHHWGNYALSGLTSVTDIYQDLNHHTRNEEPLLIPSSDIDVMSWPLTSRTLFHRSERREGAHGEKPCVSYRQLKQVGDETSRPRGESESGGEAG